jgi:hypothetical protein
MLDVSGVFFNYRAIEMAYGLDLISHRQSNDRLAGLPDHIHAPSSGGLASQLNELPSDRCQPLFRGGAQRHGAER